MTTTTGLAHSPPSAKQRRSKLDDRFGLNPLMNALEPAVKEGALSASALRRLRGHDALALRGAGLDGARRPHRRRLARPVPAFPRTSQRRGTLRRRAWPGGAGVAARRTSGNGDAVAQRLFVLRRRQVRPVARAALWRTNRCLRCAGAGHVQRARTHPGTARKRLLAGQRRGLRRRPLRP